MKKILLLILVCITFEGLKAQQNYCDFDGNKAIHFGLTAGILDSAALNPGPGPLNTSAKCGKYIRDTALYDNIKMYPDTKLTDVSSYATLTTLKMKMKIFTSAPVGSTVQLQLGSKSDDNYPSGVHSEYTAVTSVQNGWQVLSFNYLQSPSGSMVAATDVDKIVLLFRPNTSGRDTLYFDDPTGPELMVSSIREENLPLSKLQQNSPNPARETTHIPFQLTATGMVSLKIYDILGNAVISLLNQNMKAGNYNIPVETTTIPNGVYFYVLETNGTKRSMKMIVSN